MASSQDARRHAASGPSVGLLFAAAAFSAAANVAAYPPLGAWPVAFVMLAPLVAALDRATPRVAFWMTYGYQVAAAVAITRWLVVPMAADFGVAAWRAWIFTVGLVALYALLHALVAALWAGLRPRFGETVAPLAFAAIWALGEALRAGPLGLPWLLTAHAVVMSPEWIQVADLGGTLAVGFPVLAVSAGLGMAFARRSWRPLLAPALVALCSFAYGQVRINEAPPLGPRFEVGVVQAAVPPRERFLEGSAQRNLERHLEASRALLGEGPLDLIVWAETSIDAYLKPGSEVSVALQRFVDRTGVALVTGAARNHGDQVYTNSILLFVPGGTEPESYDKQHLVPFAEYAPAFGKLLDPLISELSREIPFRPGTEPHVFRSGPMSFAAPICFEISYPDEVRQFRAGGAQLLLNLSNDAWFGRTGFAELHLGQAQLRAVELRTWLVRGANTGISALIDPQGRLQESRPVFQPGTLRGRVGLAGPETFFSRHGVAPTIGLLIAGLVIALARGRECAR